MVWLPGYSLQHWIERDGTLPAHNYHFGVGDRVKWSWETIKKKKEAKQEDFPCCSLCQEWVAEHRLESAVDSLLGDRV